jgi:hypothetical protein
VDEPIAVEFKPPYLSFQTFWTFITDLALKPLPPQIDRSLMQSKSGSDQANLTAAMKGFGLIKDDLTVDTTLELLHAAEEDERKTMLGELVRTFYSEPLRVSEHNGTPKQLDDAFKDSFGLEGETRRKAVTFFLHAARTAEVPLSPNFPKTRPGAGGMRRRSTTKRTSKADNGVIESPTAPKPAGETKIVDFGEIGSVTVTVAVKWLELPTEKMISLRRIVDELEGLGARDVPADGSEIAQDAEEEAAT